MINWIKLNLLGYKRCCDCGEPTKNRFNCNDCFFKRRKQGGWNWMKYAEEINK